MKLNTPDYSFDFQAMSESITSVCGGCVSSSGYDEIVAATYAGWVVGLTTEPQQKELGPTTATQEPISDEVQAKMDNLRYDSIKHSNIVITKAPIPSPPLTDPCISFSGPGC